ncbi:MAG TPA: prepilin-type N-terminal cleavage/methylation domain-containing protein [Lacunisphaera sp.]|nr:prepilin-type N-terminal cleavage/methylation domain-containing protein [Lacunisphaera sp.]
MRTIQNCRSDFTRLAEAGRRRTSRFLGPGFRTAPALRIGPRQNAPLPAPRPPLPAPCSPLTAPCPLLRAPQRAFTLVEILVASSLALMVMTAVLTTYVAIGRNFTRSLGVSSANQPTLASQARRTLALFAQDVRMASGIDTTGTAPKVVPSSTGVTLIEPVGSGSKYVTYYFNATTSPVTLSTYSVPALSLVRIDLSTSSLQVLHQNLLSAGFAISFYDSSGRAYSSSDLASLNYIYGIKQLSLSFTSQAGSATNGTLTQVYQTDSPRVLLRNRALLQ